LVLRGALLPAGRAEIRACLRGETSQPKSLDDARWLFELVRRTGSLDRARAVAATQAEEARRVLATLEWIPPSRHRDVLAGLVDYVHERTR
jgi:geranylgeranyl diphosphate synthase type II